MISVYVTAISVLIFTAFFILIRAIREKPSCSIVITAISPGDIAELLASSADSKANSIYIVTNGYDKKYFEYLEKHYFVKEVLTVVDRDN
jgi:hypothetical protein